MVVQLMKIPVWFVKTIGHCVNVAVLLTLSYIIRLMDWIARSIVSVVESVTGANVQRDKIAVHRQRYSNKPVYSGREKSFIDSTATLKKSDFPYSPEELIARTKVLLSPEVELGSKKPELLAGDFQFIFPVVGPLNKSEFCTIFSGFRVRDAFPNTENNYFGFTVDPLEPNRVWFFTRAEMVHEGTLKIGSVRVPPTKKKVVITPQVLSMSFDTDGRCYKFTGGYSIDRTAGNCDGLGGMFGILHSVGGSLPFPEGRPWKPSLEWEALVKRVPQIGLDWADLKKGSQD